MTNYKLIADRAVQINGSADPTQYQTAYDVMVSEEISTDITYEVRITEAYIVSGLGLTAGSALIGKLSAIDPIVERLLQGAGINVIDAESKSQVAALLTGSVITQEEHEWIVSHYTQKLPAWPGLKSGHVQNALEYRFGGSV